MCGRFVGNFAVADVVDELLAAGIERVTVEDGVPERVSNFNTAPTTSWSARTSSAPAAAHERQDDHGDDHQQLDEGRAHASPAGPGPAG